MKLKRNTIIKFVWVVVALIIIFTMLIWTLGPVFY